MKDIQGYEGMYAVTEDGRVWSYKSKKFLKPFEAHKGYLKVCLCKGGQSKRYFVHRLVAMTYLPNEDNLPQVNHIDEDRKNNCVSNLEWCTAQYNTNYGTRNERAAQKLRKPVYCVELDRVFESQSQAAKELGVWQGNITKCCTGKAKTTGGYHFEFVK